MALGALGMDEAGRREREHNKALYNWHRTTDIKVQPANSGGTKARWAQQHQKGIAAKTAEENRTGQLQSDTQWQAEKELERLGHKDFSAAYSSDPLLMAWLKTKS
jgi:hypothetical protein